MSQSTAKVSVLFVDDDERLLQGLRRMLRPMRDEWDMTFVGGGAEALDHMAAHHVDVIVSDMRMPKMDGAMRIILSGFAENETVMKTVGPSHQYLAKPCDPEVLKKTIHDSLDLRRLLADETLRDLVAGLKAVPAPSSAFRNLLSELASPRATAASVADTITADVGLAAQTLKLTNSAYFSLPQKLTSIEQAVKLLGFDTIRSLATIANFYAAYAGDETHMRILETLSRRSMSIARLARAICRAENLGVEDCETAFCGGLMSHVGTLVLVTNLPDRFDVAMTLVDKEELSPYEAETRVFGATHAVLGAYLLGLWGFPCRVVNVVATHHAPTAENFGAGAAVHVAQYITREADHAGDDRPPMLPYVFDQAWLERTGRAHRLQEWRRLYEEVRNDGA